MYFYYVKLGNYNNNKNKNCNLDILKTYFLIYLYIMLIS